MKAGFAAFVIKVKKHQANDGKCAELGWVSITLVVGDIWVLRYRGQVGSITACLRFSHAAQVHSNFISWATELDPCQGQCEGTAFKIHPGPN